MVCKSEGRHGSVLSGAGDGGPDTLMIETDDAKDMPKYPLRNLEKVGYRKRLTNVSGRELRHDDGLYLEIKRTM